MYYQKYTPRFIWVFLALIIFNTALHVFIFITNGVWIWLSFLPPIIIFSLLSYAFRFYFVFADHEQLRFGYSLWGGQGWRLKSLKHIGYIIGNGSGIHLILKTGREYTFNCDDPNACIRTLQIDTSNDAQETEAEENLMTSAAVRESNNSIVDQQIISNDPR
jgi:hypothetical protein